MTRPLGPVCGALLALDREHSGLASDVHALDRHGEIADLMAKVLATRVEEICDDYGWTAPGIAEALLNRGVSARWIVSRGLGGVLDLVLDRM